MIIMEKDTFALELILIMEAIVLNYQMENHIGMEIMFG